MASKDWLEQNQREKRGGGNEGFLQEKEQRKWHPCSMSEKLNQKENQLNFLLGECLQKSFL